MLRCPALLSEVGMQGGLLRSDRGGDRGRARGGGGAYSAEHIFEDRLGDSWSIHLCRRVWVSRAVVDNVRTQAVSDAHWGRSDGNRAG